MECLFFCPLQQKDLRIQESSWRNCMQLVFFCFYLCFWCIFTSRFFLLRVFLGSVLSWPRINTLVPTSPLFPHHPCSNPIVFKVVFPGRISPRMLWGDTTFSALSIPAKHQCYGNSGTKCPSGHIVLVVPIVALLFACQSEPTQVRGCLAGWHWNTTVTPPPAGGNFQLFTRTLFSPPSGVCWFSLPKKYSPEFFWGKLSLARFPCWDGDGAGTADSPAGAPTSAGSDAQPAKGGQFRVQ